MPTDSQNEYHFSSSCLLDESSSNFDIVNSCINSTSCVILGLEREGTHTCFFVKEDCELSFKNCGDIRSDSYCRGKLTISATKISLAECKIYEKCNEITTTSDDDPTPIDDSTTTENIDDSTTTENIDDSTTTDNDDQTPTFGEYFAVLFADTDEPLFGETTIPSEYTCNERNILENNGFCDLQQFQVNNVEINDLDTTSAEEFVPNPIPTMSPTISSLPDPTEVPPSNNDNVYEPKITVKNVTPVNESEVSYTVPTDVDPANNEVEYVAPILTKNVEINITGEGGSNFYFKPEIDETVITIRSTNTTFGVKLEGNKKATAKISQQEIKMNLKGSGTVSIEVVSSISTTGVRIGNATVSNGDSLTISISSTLKNKVTLNEINLVALSNVQATSTINAEAVKVQAGALSTLNRVNIIGSLDIAPLASLTTSNVNLKGINVNFCFSKKLPNPNNRPMLVGDFESDSSSEYPSSIKIIESSINEPLGISMFQHNELDETEYEDKIILVQPSKISDVFTDCYTWKELINLDGQSRFVNAVCVESSQKSYVESKNPNQLILSNVIYKDQKDGLGKHFDIGIIIGIVVGVLVIVSVIIGVSVYFEKLKRKDGKVNNQSTSNTYAYSGRNVHQSNHSNHNNNSNNNRNNDTTTIVNSTSTNRETNTNIQQDQTDSSFEDSDSVAI